jgi:hypothetical protein
MALSTPFIEDYSEVDADGKLTKTLKSLQDLNAEMIETDITPLLSLLQ